MDLKIFGGEESTGSSSHKKKLNKKDLGMLAVAGVGAIGIFYFLTSSSSGGSSGSGGTVSYSGYPTVSENDYDYLQNEIQEGIDSIKEAVEINDSLNDEKIDNFYEELKNSIANQEETYKNQIDSLKDSYESQLATHNDYFSSQITSLKETNKNLESSLNSVTEKNTNLQASVENLQKDNSSLKNSVSTLTKTNKKQDSTITNLKTQLKNAMANKTATNKSTTTNKKTSTNTPATNNTATNKSTTTKKSNYITIKNGSKTSIVDTLKKNNVDSSFENRKKIAKANGIKNYTGTASQNIKLNNLANSGKLKNTTNKKTTKKK